MSLLTFKNSNIQENASDMGTKTSDDARRTLGFKANANSSNFAKSGNSLVSNPLNASMAGADKQKKISKKINNQSVQQNQIISGYFIKEKSYKEMVIARVNNFLCGVLAFLVMVCLVSYYYVINGEIQLNQIRKETLAINYENEDMQHKLDILQSFSNVDRQVSRTKILQTAKQVIELSAANLPNVNYENKNVSPVPGWSMGY